MNKLLSLQKFVILNDLQISRLNNANSKSDRNHATLTIAGYCAALFIAISYVLYIAFDLYSNDQVDILLPVLSSLLFWVFGIWTILSGVKKIVFSNDRDFIFSLPLPLWQLRLFHLIKLFFIYTSLIAVALLAAVCSYLLIVPNIPSFVFRSIVLLIMTPFLILSSTLLVSILSKWILSIIKLQNNVAEALLTVSIFLIPIVFALLNSDSLQYKSIFYLSSPLNLFGLTGLWNIENDMLRLLVMTVLTGGLTILSLWIIKYKYAAVESLFQETRKRKINQGTPLIQNNIFKQLFLKEVQLYLSSITYVSNTILTPVILLIGSLVYLSNLVPLLYTYTFEFSFITISSKYIFIIFTTICILLTTTTSSSLSFEGKSIWITLTSPLTLKDLSMAKIALNLMLFIPGVICAILVYMLHFSTSIADSLFFIVFTVSSLFLISLIGFFINLKFPNYNWSSEMEIIKQGKSTIFTAAISTMYISLNTVLSILGFNLALPMLALFNLILIFLLIKSMKEQTLVLN